jgi:DNA uptake protein ComE-like DNA-binding protein
MTRFLQCCALASTLCLAVGCAADPTVATATSALTTTDVDVAPECQGILDYVNTVQVSHLRYYLPDTLADAIAARRAQTPFTSLMDLSSLSGIAQGRLAQIAGGARTLDYIDQDCAGVWEELAVSHDDMVAILAFANSATEAQLLDALPSNHNVVPGIVAYRPFASLDALVAVKQMGPAALRYLRNAATHQGALDELAADVTAAERDVDIRLGVNWQGLLLGQDQPGQLSHATCFGVDPQIVASIGGTLRPELATPAEVHADVLDAYNYANRYSDLGLDPTAGLADLDARVAGHSLSGCILRYTPDPWSGVNRAFFFDPATGFQILTDIRWSE